jgi:AcrR family transcriptional regulator
MGTSAAPENDHVGRLLDGMARAVAATGYVDATIADIVREAGVSRRTFYEHFATKAECLIALYEMASLRVLGVLRKAIDGRQHWDAQLEEALAAYFAAMAANPDLLRTLFIEILGLGSAGLAARRRVNQQIAEFILFVANSPSAGRKRKLSPQMAVAVVGGINELVLTYIERDRVSALRELVGPASELVRAAVQAPNSRA